MDTRAKSNAGRTLQFDQIQEGDLPGVLAIEKVVNSAPWSERSFRNELNHEHGIFLVARSGSEIVGYGGAWLVIDEAHVTNLAVSPEFRRNGIGRMLMIELLARTKECGMTCSTLEVRASNEAAIELYRQLGYEVTAKRKGYYPDNHEDAVVMWLHDLERWEPPTR